MEVRKNTVCLYFDFPFGLLAFLDATSLESKISDIMSTLRVYRTVSKLSPNLRQTTSPLPLPRGITFRAMATAAGMSAYKGKTVTLNTGQQIPAIGLGTFQDPDEQEMSVYNALKNGYRHIDTAHK